MKRTWAVRPDTAMERQDGMVVPYVSREAMVEGYMDALSMHDRGGGIITVVAGRAATDLPGEMLTTHLVFEWRDRNEATVSPERPSAVLPEPVNGADPVLNGDGSTGWAHEDPTPAELEARLEGEAEARAASGGELDGLDPSTLEEEDLSSVPESAR